VQSGGSGALTEFAEESARSGFDEVQYFLEAVRPAVVRIGYFLGLAVGCELEKQPHPLTCLLRRTPVQHRQILAIHGENEVELLEIPRLDDPRTQCVEGASPT